MKKTCKGLPLDACWRSTLKLSRRNFLLLTCPVSTNFYVASSFSFLYSQFFIHIWFGFDKAKVTNRKLYGEFQLIVKYNFKERDWTEIVPKMSGIFRGNCCKTCPNIHQKTPLNGFIMENSLTKAISERLQQLLLNKKNIR